MTYAVFSSLKVQWHLTTARPMMRYVLWVAPLVYAALGAFSLKHRGAAGLEYAVVGSALITLWSSTIWSSGTDISRERSMGNFEYLMITPVSLFWSTLGKTLGNVILGIIGCGTGFLYSKYLFGLPVSFAEPLWLAVGLLATVFSFMGIALTMATGVIFSRQSELLMNGMSYPIYILAGLMFPLDLLPGWTLPFSRALPLTWARQALGAAVTGDGARFWTAAAWLVGLGLLYWASALWLFKAVDRKAREKGELN